jgi:SAM-dependent methyltransferase
MAHQGGDDQTTLWNGRAGRAWIGAQPVLDQMFLPFQDLMVEAAANRSARRVLDVGCGTGSTTIAIARRLGANGSCVGIDISEPMIAVARARAARDHSSATFIVANAQDHDFDAGSFDLIVSRFGVMFFDDPVRAFANLRRATSDSGVLECIAWRSAADNPFMTTAERAAAPLLANLPPRQPGAPGQFAFADRDRVHAILESSGWTGIDIRPIDVPCVFPERELDGYLTRLGPVGQVLEASDDQTRRLVVDVVRAAFAPFVQDGEVRFTAACWMVGARATSA